MWVQQWILRKVNLLLFRHPLVVHFVFVPTFLQPADLVSRLEASCGGCRTRAFEIARGIWRQLGDNVSYALYIGSVARYVGDALGPVVPLPGEFEGRGWDCGVAWYIVGIWTGGVGGWIYSFRGVYGSLGMGPRAAPGALWQVRGGGG